MKGKTVSVAEGKRDFTQLLKESREKHTPILIMNERSHELAGVILGPEEYAQYERIQAYFLALRLSKKFAHLQLDVAELVPHSPPEPEGPLT